MFPGGVGNTQKDPARFDSLYADVTAKIFGRLPDATWVYPGHGGDTTTEEKATRRIASAMKLPGFRKAPAGFEVARYVVDRDQWAEGFVTS